MKAQLKPLRFGVKICFAYLATNLNVCLVLHLVYLHNPDSRHLTGGPIAGLHDRINFWDSSLNYWETSYVNMTWRIVMVRQVSIWFFKSTGMAAESFFLLYEAFFTSLYGGMFYFTLGSLMGLGYSRVNRWMMHREAGVNKTGSIKYLIRTLKSLWEEWYR